MNSLCLTREDLEDLTGKVRPSAQRRALNAIGIDVRGVRPDGTLVVLRSAVEGRGSAARPKPGPDFSALTDVA